MSFVGTAYCAGGGGYNGSGGGGGYGGVGGSGEFGFGSCGGSGGLFVLGGEGWGEGEGCWGGKKGGESILR